MVHDSGGHGLPTPTLAAFVRFSRERHSVAFAEGATRQQLAEAAHVSIAYLAKIEAGVADSPTARILRSLSDALSLNVDEVQHMFDLAGRSSENERVSIHVPSTVAEYRSMIDPDLLATFQALDPHLIAMLDERWNVIVCNDAYDRAYPGLVDSTNVLSWFFTDPRSRQVMVDWESEASLTVGWFRALSGRYQDSSWSQQILRELASNVDFRRMWNRNHLAFGRDDPWMKIRDLNDGTIYHAWVRIYATAQSGHQLQLFSGIRREPTASAENRE